MKTTLLGLLYCVTQLNAATYYVAAAGADSNNGTSQSTPWLHAPGMPNCSAVCASTAINAGDRVVLRGGDTWHFGNSAASPAVGGTWRWNKAGAAGNPTYLGVDQTWYNSAVCGSSWCRPVMNGDNPTSTAGVSSCAYPITAAFMNTQGIANTTIDNLEFTGMCWSGTPAWNQAVYMVWGSGQTTAQNNQTVSNVYIHGWTHVTFNCSSGGGNCDAAAGFNGVTGNNYGVGDRLTHIVCDGSDADGHSLACVYGNGYQIDSSVFRYASNGTVINNAHLFHDNLIEYIPGVSDGVGHTNGFEFNKEAPSVNYIYNNVIRHNTVAVTEWLCGSQHDYYFNNVSYDNVQQTFDDTGQCGSPTYYAYNNIWVGGGNVGGNGLAVYVNNLFINTNTSDSKNSSFVSYTTAQATAAGYTSGNSYAPTSNTCNGISPCPLATGQNLSSVCASDPILQANLCSATTQGCGYNSSAHSVTCPNISAVARPVSAAWDLGAYQFSAGAPLNACDLTQDGTVNSSDVQAAIAMTLGQSACTADVVTPGVCNVVVVQRVVNASLGGSCRIGP